MDIVVQHKDRWGNVTNERAVRTGTLLDYVACVPCKGTGSRHYCVGGSLTYFGWAIYQDFGCGHCRGLGTWRCH